MTSALSPEDERRFQDALPAFLAGQLTGPQQAWMQQARQQHPALDAEARTLEQLRSALRDEAAHEDTGLAWQRLQQQLHPVASAPTRGADKGPARASMWAALRAFLHAALGARPALALASLVIVVQAGAIGWLLQTPRAAEVAPAWLTGVAGVGRFRSRLADRPPPRHRACAARVPAPSRPPGLPGLSVDCGGFVAERLVDSLVSGVKYGLIIALAALGLVLLTGVGGLTSFGQAAFVGIGAYATAWWTTAQGGSPWTGLALALLADRWARDNGGSILAITVDHGLRPEAAAEVQKQKTYLDEAFRAYKTCAEKFPASKFAGDALSRMADYYYNKEDYSRAIDIYEEAIKMNQDSKFLDNILYGYGRCLVKMKRLDAALEKFRTLMLTYPNSPLAPKAKQIAEAIEKKLTGASASAAPGALRGAGAPTSFGSSPMTDGRTSRTSGATSASGTSRWNSSASTTRTSAATTSAPHRGPHPSASASR